MARRNNSQRRSESHESPDRPLRASGSVSRPHDTEQTTASIAQEAIRRDLEDDGELDDHYDAGATLSRTVSRDHHLGPHALVGNRRRPSYAAAGPRTFIGAMTPETIIPIEQEVDDAIEEERSLLRDNNIIPRKSSRSRRESQSSVASRRSLRHRLSIPGFSNPRRDNAIEEEESGRSPSDNDNTPTEATALLGDSSVDVEAAYDSADISKKWEEAVLAGQIETTWQREALVVLKTSLPLIITFALEVSFTMTSIFTVGRLGENALGAVAVGSMTASITGYSVYFGLSTSLDTLCAQAYGSGKKTLVGLQFQRMVWFSMVCTIPIAIIWWMAPQLLLIIIPEREIAEYAGLYLRILILGAPAFALFESAKKYVQASGHFESSLYALLIAAPTNVFLHWFLVWRLGWGFIGCPIAVVIAENLMPLVLFFYVRFFIGLECWPGFTWKAFRNWGPMIRLSIPGLVMVMTEMLAFEILVLASSQMSATHIAANAVLQSISVFTYQFPFPMSIAASTRVANLIGAGLPEAAKKTVRVTFVLGAIMGILNMVLVGSLRHRIAGLYSDEAAVIKLAAETLPINAAFQLFDAVAAQCNGVLRGLGKQKIGGYMSLLAFYLIGIPISFGTGFGLHWDLKGLWTGPAVALFIVCVGSGFYIYHTDWEKATEEAAKRNAEA